MSADDIEVFHCDSDTQSDTDTCNKSLQAIFRRSLGHDACIVPTADRLHREKVLQRLTSAIKQSMETLDAEDDDSNDVLDGQHAADHARVVEQCLYERYYLSDPGQYASRCASLEFNLQQNGKYLLTHFGPETICAMPATKLAEHTSVGKWRDSELTRLLKDVRRRRSSHDAAALTNDESADSQTATDGGGMFRCPKCKSSNTTYYAMQTRGADEPMTNFVTCLACNKRFRR